MRKPFFISLMISSLVVVLSTRGLAAGEIESKFIELIQQRYCSQDGKQVKIDSLKSIESIVATLDEQSSLIRKSELENAHEGGIGVQIVRKDKEVILYPLVDSPADSALILPGDTLVSVDGILISELRTSEIVSLLRGEIGTAVRLFVESRGESITHFLWRSKIDIQSIQAGALHSRTGYVKINHFGQNTAKLLSDQIDKLRNRGMRQLVIDVRNNQGGLLNGVALVLELFLPAGSDLYEIKCPGAPESKRHQLRRTSEKQKYSFPLAVIVDGSTLSGAEAFAKVLQARKRATIIGSGTPGNGSIQTMHTVNDTLYFKLTTGYIYIDRTQIEKMGVCPDRSVVSPGKVKYKYPATDDELKTAIKECPFVKAAFESANQ